MRIIELSGEEGDALRRNLMFATIAQTMQHIYRHLPDNDMLREVLKRVDEDIEVVAPDPEENWYLPVLQNARSLLVIAMSFNEAYDRGKELSEEAVRRVEERLRAEMEKSGQTDEAVQEAMRVMFGHMGEWGEA